MYRTALALLIATSSISTASAQGAAVQLTPQTVLPIVFTQTVSAMNTHTGATVSAKTIQSLQLPNGTVIPAGSRVVGHVAEAQAFAYDKTLYSKQKDSTLTIHFDSIEARGETVPLSVTVRAMADYFASNAAQEPKSTDLDPLGTLTLVGGDLLTPSQTEVRNMDNDIVAYNRHGGVFAHLIANGHCDGGSTEVSMGIYSPSACGLYGYAGVAATEFGSVATPSTLTLISHRASPEIAKHSTALLEVLPQEQASAGR